MDTARPELPIRPEVPALGRCADLPRALAGASPEDIERAVSSLASQLKQLGWQEVAALPGLRTYASNGRMLALDQLVGMISRGYMTPANWEATCATDGISELLVPVPRVAAAQGNQAPPGGYQDPFAAVGGSGEPGAYGSAPVEESNAKKIGTWMIIGLIFALSFYARLDRDSAAGDHLAGHIGTEGETEVAYDGKLGVDGGTATSIYVKQDHEFESVEGPAPDPELRDLVTMERDGVSTYAGGGRNHMTLSHAVQRKDLNNPAALKQWINTLNVEASSVNQIVTPRRSKMAGEAAWVWEWTCSSGCWNYAIRVPRGKDVYSVRCRLMPSENTPAAQARCKGLAKNLKIASAKA